MKQWIYGAAYSMLVLGSCQQQAQPEKNSSGQAGESPKVLDLQEAERLVDLPLSCIDVEYPNKLNQVIASNRDLREPSDLHPAFYGCFDWHSAVHGHWSLIRLVRLYPDLKDADRIIAGLEAHLTKENITLEINYFKNETNNGFERMYGWAWLLKLAEELERWDHPRASALRDNIRPLSDLIVQLTIEHLPKLNYPIRVGTHTNTAFALSMMMDYAETTQNEALKTSIAEHAKKYFGKDEGGALKWEPSGYDFLSPCLEEADLMRKVLSKKEFENWLEKFLPELIDENFELAPGIVSDREDGHLVHLDGLNFSRAWCLYGIAETFPEKYGHLSAIGNKHIEHSLPAIVGDTYEGGHWLGSFALMALTR